MKRLYWLALAGAAALAIAVRLTYLHEIAGNPLYQVLTGDPLIYQKQAMDVLAGRLPDHPYFYSGPLFPVFLAAIMRLLTRSLEGIRIVQACIGTVSVVLISLLAKVAFGRRAAIIAACLAALYTPLIFFESEILEITLVVALVTGMLLALARADTSPGPLRTGLAGVLLGLAALGKANLLLFAPVGAVLLLVDGGRRPGRRALAAAAFVATAGITILPVTLHNHATSGDLIPICSSGGINLYIGNHPGASGVFEVPDQMLLDLRVASAEEAERALGRLSAGDVSDHWAGRAVAYMRERPGEWLKLARQGRPPSSGTTTRFPTSTTSTSCVSSPRCSSPHRDIRRRRSARTPRPRARSDPQEAECHPSLSPTV